MKQTATVKEIVNFINAIRNLDEHGVTIVSNVIAAELNAGKSERKKVLSLVK